MANLRFEVVAEAFKKRPVEVEAPRNTLNFKSLNSL